MGAAAAEAFPQILDRLLDRRSLGTLEARQLMEQVLAGDLGPERLAALVTAIRSKPLDAGELAGFALALRGRGRPVPVAPGTRLLDTCGTGAARVKTFNVSTAAACVAAAAGVPVAKHGNRSVTRPSGSSDLLERAGANLALSPERAAGILAEHGLVFLHAPEFHPAMRHAAGVRQALGVRTVFNLLGPLCNPAGATHHVIGVYDTAALRPMADALRILGVRDAYVLHGEPGLDEASASGATHAVRLHNGAVGPTLVHTPEQLGVARHGVDLMAPVPAAQAPALLRAILAGEGGPQADLVAVNAAFGLEVAGKADSLQDGVRLAQQVLASGDALRLFDRYVAATRA